MDATKTDSTVYLCERCDTWFIVTTNDESPRLGQAYYFGDICALEEEVCAGGHDEHGDCNYVYLLKPDEWDIAGRLENVWWCAEGCFHHDEGQQPTYYPGYECGNCGTVKSREAAAECCR